MALDYEELILDTVGLLLDRHMSGIEIMTELQITRNQFYKLKDKMRDQGLAAFYNPSTNTYSLKNNRALTFGEAEIVARIDKAGLNRRQIDSILQAFSMESGLPIGPYKIEFSKNKIVFGVIADTHMGSKKYRRDIFRHAAVNFARHNVDFIINGGDTIEGISGRADQWLELDRHHGLGLTEQIDYMTEEFAQFGDTKAYSIEAQGSHGGWAYASHAGAQGLKIHDYIIKSVPQYVFLGYNEADLIINGITIRVRHPERKGVIAYIDDLMPNDKPHILIQAHFHNQVGYQLHRNVHAIDAGCMQNATPFLERKGSVPVLGYWIIEIVIGDTPSTTGQTLLKDGKYVESLEAKFIPFYDKGEEEE